MNVSLKDYFKSIFLLLFLVVIIAGCGDNRTEEEKLRAYYEEVKLYSHQLKSIVKNLEDEKITNPEAYKQLTAIMKKFDKLDPKIEELNFGEETGDEGSEILSLLYYNMFDEMAQYTGFQPDEIEYKLTPDKRLDFLIFTKNTLARTAKDLYNSTMLYAQKCGASESKAGTSAYSMGTNTAFLTLAGEITQENAIYSIEVLDYLFSRLDKGKPKGE